MFYGVLAGAHPAGRLWVALYKLRVGAALTLLALKWPRPDVESRRSIG